MFSFNFFLNKYRFNQLLFLFVISNLSLSFWFLWMQENIFNWLSIVFFGLNVILLHYCFNLIHLASHKLLSKNRFLNSLLGNLVSIYGGLTFADFRTTHLEHHRHTLNPSKDPDHEISQFNFWFMPFTIWLHDKFFWKQGLATKNSNWKGYIFDRIVQVTLVLFFIINQKVLILLIFWLLPLYVVGFFNGMFLFYFPHYGNNFEKNLRNKIAKHPSRSHILVIFSRFILFLIDLSRLIHQKHHQKVSVNLHYFPELRLLNYFY